MIECDNKYFESLDFEKYKQSRQKKARFIEHILRSFQQDSEVIVDIGGGTGLIARELSEKWNKEILVLDRDIGLLRETCNQVTSIAGDILNLPLKSNSVDMFIINHVWEHIGDQKTAMNEIAGSLSKNGIIYLTLGNRAWIIEPHFKLPFLSILPKKIANFYLSLFMKGQNYDNINFPFPWQLYNSVFHEGLEWEDITYKVLMGNHGILEKKWWKLTGRLLSLIPERLAKPLLFLITPQWFLIGRKKGA